MISTNTKFNRLHTDQDIHSERKETAEPSLNQHSEDAYYQNGQTHMQHQNSLLDLLTKNKMILIFLIVLFLVSWWAWKVDFKGLSNKNQTQTHLDHSLQEISNPINKVQSIEIPITKPNLLKITKSSEQLQNIIKTMQNPKDRPKVIRNVKKSTAKQDEVYFAYSLSKQPLNQEYLEAEYYYYNRKYNFDSIKSEVPICAVVVGRNLGEGYNRMINSIFRQNYTNFRVVFVDDYSDDATRAKLQQFISQNDKIRQKTQFIWQSERKYALFNRNLAIRTSCKEGDIIVDLDADDWLIGSQVFNVVNALYQKPQLWACYFNNIIYSQACNCPLMNADAMIPPEILRSNTYRTSNIWRTTQLRTYRRDLYMKIDESDFVDEKGKYFKWKSDAFINIPIVELSGPDHVQFLDEFLYYYDTHFSKASQQKSFSRLSIKTKTPYKPLSSLQDRPAKQQDYSPPQQLVKKLKQLSNANGF